MPDQSSFFAHGSRWVRADFHLHTRRDKEFKDEGAEQDFVARYTAALKSADIHIGAITNHNKFDRDEFKALRKAAKKEDIHLLPGIELSVKDGANGIHTLVIFSDEWIVNAEQTDHINSFLGVTFAGQSNYDNSNARSNHDLLDTIRELNKFGRDYFLIFAHVEADNGLYGPGGLQGGRLQELGRTDLFRERTAAFQKVGTRDLKQKVQCWLGDWYPAEVEGSDPKAMSEIGRGEKSFIKIGAFTFEAVQFALKPGADRLCSQEVKPQPHSWVQAIRFEGGILDGKRMAFSPEMSCLIGIRGSGKSAILECLRYALELPMPESSDEVDLMYKEGLVRFALKSGGKVVVEAMDAQGRTFEIRRILNERRDVYYDGELRPGVSIPIKNPLFFGQKELVKRGEGSERELIERLIGAKLDTVRRELIAQRQRVLDVLTAFDKLKDLDIQQAEYEAKKRDTEFRLKLFRDFGVEDQLKRQVQFNADETHARRATDSAQAFVRAFDAFLKEQEAELSALPRLEPKENADVIEEMNALLDRIRKTPEKVRQVLTEAQNDARSLRDKLGELQRRREALKEEFAAIERRLSEKLQQQGGVSVRPDDFVRLNADLQKVTLALTETAKSRTKKNALRDELLRELKRLNDLWHQEFKEIEREIKNLNESQTALQIAPKYKGGRAAMIEEMKGHFRGSRLHTATLESALAGHADFVSVYEALDTVCNGLGESGEVFRRYFNEAKASLLVWQVPNTYQIMYHGKELREHSLGQRASALILFILSQRDNDLIVIDQPEDDLDNQTIFQDVIKLIRALKKGIQFIFATHNANFPVLGDAEQVGACSFVSGAGAVEVGSIDQPEIQKAIVSIMEGGHEAFARRKEIYQLWKQ
ncbi:MAG TPA: AAA family ATPase [Candidatus Paceibacterota bacterium]|nr:AAA family ATPase [Verrucomicrobiota bacterium]HRY47491.1 AAA family ATPase [Candidatus Paceibacterota bacterium]